ncbi:Xenotropic and polytropic retrovirus receptor [Zostera marina]|uniref:Xenotropic and polytropic retrovirus receptor n=1 Tax=Zostera marina TaxID=29655 RepID=A0A0K9PR22_ZOSMR|nr:Xenotropic and polytropic retrovirus receptor [Zostera marina]
MLSIPFISSNSPFLRRSGSKPVLSDSGSVELDDTRERVLNFATETIENKGGDYTMYAMGKMMVPSQVFLWRFKVLLFLLLCISCLKVCWESVMRMDAGVRNLFLYEAFLYYNPLLLITLMVWLWGLNLWVFSHSSVSYSKIFDLDHNHLSHIDIWKSATWMTVIVPTSMTAYIYLYSHREELLAASQPVVLYMVSLMILIFPFDIFYLSSRYYLLRTIWRIILPLQSITFSDFFLADILTSMSKVLSDLERSVCRMLNRQVATIAWLEADSICGSHSGAIPLVLAFPYLCRFFQCLRQYRDTKEKNCLFNALKYATAMPVIFLSALKYHAYPEKWIYFYRPLWLLSSVINSSYSFYWDVTRDWDLSNFTRIFKFKNPSRFSNIFYGRPWVYYWVLGSNLILRCTWTYKLSSHLRHNYLTVFTITSLEIFRRFQWVFFRVENEWNKMSQKAVITNSATSTNIPMDDIPSEKDGLLDSSDHVV